MSILVSIFTWLLFVCAGSGLYLNGYVGAWLGMLAAVLLTGAVLGCAFLLAVWHDRRKAS